MYYIYSSSYLTSSNAGKNKEESRCGLCGKSFESRKQRDQDKHDVHDTVNDMSKVMKNLGISAPALTVDGLCSLNDKCIAKDVATSFNG